ncbi:MAG: class I SAM-dependent methyltransferase [Anaerolineales bacterium]|nr:MAG: class I SAM-dependent methyltransferase [Anaerolineales bacterium]
MAEFEIVNGLDFSSTAIQRARRRANVEGIEVQFIVDNLTDLQNASGTFDPLIGFGAG